MMTWELRVSNYQQTKLKYWVVGEGSPVLLLHGYLQNANVWSEIARQLHKNFRLIIPELALSRPEVEGEPTNFGNLLLNVLENILVVENANSVACIGHSMGGYLGLEILLKKSHCINKLILISSHPYCDTPEKINFRNREIALVKSGERKRLSLFRFKKYFGHQPNIKSLDWIQELNKMSNSVSETTMINCLNYMMKRTDKCELLKNTPKPVYCIFGEFEKNEEVVFFRNNLHEFNRIIYRIVPNTGHFVLLEEPEITIQLLYSWLIEME